MATAVAMLATAVAVSWFCCWPMTVRSLLAAFTVTRGIPRDHGPLIEVAGTPGDQFRADDVEFTAQPRKLTTMVWSAARWSSPSGVIEILPHSCTVSTA